MPGFLPFRDHVHRPPGELIRRAAEFSAELQRRRTVRQFSPEPVPREVIEQALAAAGSAPSGANRQPWHFVAVGDPALKREIRLAAEQAEERFYRTAPPMWLAALEPLGTDPEKPFLETAPWLIAIFTERYRPMANGARDHNYYVSESTGIATGFLIAALHFAGLTTLTHTPSPMHFLSRILGRPDNERPFLLLVTGYPASDATVPDIRRKPLEAFTTWR